jgi:site-specific recombinase XerD
MSLRKRGQRYVVDYYPHGRKGKRKRISLPVGISDELAQKVHDEIMQMNQEEKNPGSTGDGTIEEHLEQYLSWYEVHRSRTTCRDIRSIHKNHFSKYFGPVLAENIGLQHIESYKRIRKEQGVSNRTINKELNYFSGFLRWCEDQGIIRQRQFRIRPLPYKRPLPAVLTFEEAMGIVNAAEPFYQALFLALFSMGLRLQEGCRLKWSDVDMAGGRLKVIQKGGGEKVLPLNRPFVAAIQAMKTFGEGSKKIAPALGPFGRWPAENTDGYIFLNPRTGKPIQDIRRPLARAVKKAGIIKHVNPHLFRHSIATYLVGRNIDLMLISKYLGHRQVSTTQFYTHVTPEHLKGVVTGGLLNYIANNIDDLEKKCDYIDAEVIEDNTSI